MNYQDWIPTLIELLPALAPIALALAFALSGIAVLLVPLVMLAPLEGLARHRPLYHGLPPEKEKAL